MPGIEQLHGMVRETLQRFSAVEGPLLPVLHDLQDQLGYIPQEAIALIASGLRQSQAEVSGVISFYHYFRTTAPGKNRLQVCRAESCQAMGSRAIESHLKNKLGIGYHQTTPDGEITLEPVYCLGNCACSPSIRLNKEVHGRVDNSRIDELLDGLATMPVEVQ